MFKKYYDWKKKGVFLSFKNYQLITSKKKKKLFLKDSNLRHFPTLNNFNNQIFLHSGKKFLRIRCFKDFFFEKLNLFRQTKIGGFRIHIKKKKKKGKK